MSFSNLFLNKNSFLHILKASGWINLIADYLSPSASFHFADYPNDNPFRDVLPDEEWTHHQSENENTIYISRESTLNSDQRKWTVNSREVGNTHQSIPLVKIAIYRRE